MADVNTAQGIGWAVYQLQHGERIRRSGWNGKGMWICLVRGSEWDMPRDLDLKLSKHGGLEDGYEWRSDKIVMRCAGGELASWTCSQSDLLASDWEIAAAESLPP